MWRRVIWHTTSKFQRNLPSLSSVSFLTRKWQRQCLPKRQYLPIYQTTCVTWQKTYYDSPTSSFTVRAAVSPQFWGSESQWDAEKYFYQYRKTHHETFKHQAEFEPPNLMCAEPNMWRPESDSCLLITDDKCWPTSSFLIFNSRVPIEKWRPSVYKCKCRTARIWSCFLLHWTYYLKTIIQNSAVEHISSFSPTHKFLFNSLCQAREDVRHVQRHGYVSRGPEQPINYERTQWD
jgi:hypothetical protein